MRAAGWILASLLVLAPSASAQVMWVVPAWRPLPAPVMIHRPLYLIPVQQPPMRIERYYFDPRPGVQPPANSTQEREEKPQEFQNLKAGDKPEIIIREYYLWEDRPTPTTASNIKPDKLQMPPWSGSFEEETVAPERPADDSTKPQSGLPGNDAIIPPQT